MELKWTEGRGGESVMEFQTEWRDYAAEAMANRENDLMISSGTTIAQHGAQETAGSGREFSGDEKPPQKFENIINGISRDQRMPCAS
jgi:hypothetical protein